MELINLRTYPVKDVLKILLQDKTTKMNITFATNSYEDIGEKYKPESFISLEALLGLDACEIQPRVAKEKDEQLLRTRKKAEVFTPSWICNKMNNICDDEWFGRTGVFNEENDDNTWTTNTEKIEFSDDKSWKKYVDSRRLEITCGEAPYIASRYDTTTGEIIPIVDRIGILDRKLRVVNENATDDKEWLKWCERAFQSTYGYEYQGDNLLIARINLLNTFVDYYRDRFEQDPDVKQLRHYAHIITWNLWQMDGLNGTVPNGLQEPEYYQVSLFDTEETERELVPIPCKIWDWRDENALVFNSLKRGR